MLKKGPSKKPRSKRSHNDAGVKFDSDTERHFYEALVKLGHPFQFQVKYMLIGPTIHKERPDKKNPIALFRDRGAEAVTLTVDFELEKDGIHYILDTKGSKRHATTVSYLKYDILKHKIAGEGRAETTRILFINAQEVMALAKAAAFAPDMFWELFFKIKER